MQCNVELFFVDFCLSPFWVWQLIVWVACATYYNVYDVRYSMFLFYYMYVVRDWCIRGSEIFYRKIASSTCSWKRKTWRRPTSFILISVQCTGCQRYQIPVFRKLISNSKNLSKQCKFKISMPHTKGRHRHCHFLRSLHIWTGNLHSLKTLSKSRYFIKQIVLSLQNQIQFIWAL